ncbi:MAG TPA: hypothetical protein VIW29_09480 [Polyangiaceae bacterium]
MTKASFGCLAVLVPLCLVWACGSSSEGDNPGGNAAGEGSGATAASTAGSDSLGGEGNAAGNGSGASSAGGSINIGGTTGTGGTTSIGGTTNTGGTTVIGTELCGDAGCTCSNGLDDDEDGLVDGFDAECTGPFDNDEATFATGIPGDNRDPKWQDCFFDGNSGAGDDHCRYATGCLTGELDQDHPDCELSKACIDYCAPQTPNGCDCFGCCTVQLADGTNLDIQTGTACSLDKAEDDTACPVCVKSDQCGNNCGTCELCPGKTVDDLPEECSPSTGTGGAPGTGGTTGMGGSDNPPDPGYTCDNGLTVCGPDLPACAVGKYCSLGCCLNLPPR